MQEVFDKFAPLTVDVAKEVEKIKAKVSEYKNEEVYKTLFSLIDLTTLNSTDTYGKVETMAKKVNEFGQNFSNIPNVAAICVYPSLVPVVREHLTVESVNIASVTAGFPASQTFLEVKNFETKMAVERGADECDIVISIGEFFEKKYSTVYNEVKEIKRACGEAHLKTILETGALEDVDSIYKASMLSIDAGSDFIKTSTGKMEPAATLEAVYVMCIAIKEWYQKTGVKIGIKPAGGISTPEDAISYYLVVKEILGEEWINPELFRIGASRLANNLLTEITGSEVNYF